MLLTSEEAAKTLRITTSALRNLIFRGRIVPDHRGGRRGGLKGHRWSVETLKKFLDNGGGQ